MADSRAAVAPEMSVGARVGGASTVATLVSVAHAVSHAHGALPPVIVPFCAADLQPACTPIGRIADAPQHPIGNSLVAQSFRAHRRGLALAIDAASSNLGTVAVPLIGGFSIATLGWRGTLGLFGLPGIPMGALVDGYGFAATAASQVLAALVLLPAHPRQTVYAAPVICHQRRRGSYGFAYPWIDY